MSKYAEKIKQSVIPPDWDFDLIAKRFTARRKQFGWTLEQLAKKAGVSRFTIQRMEKGIPCSYPTIRKVRSSLQFFSEQLTKSDQPSANFFLSRNSSSRWMVSRPVNRRGQQMISKDLIYVDDPIERQRLGSIGFQKFFTCLPRSEFPEGVMCHGLMELYDRTPFDQHFGEELVYCLQGRVEMIIEDESCILEEGDSMIFDAWKPHSYGPDGEESFAKIMVVVAIRPDEPERIKELEKKKNLWGI